MKTIKRRRSLWCCTGCSVVLVVNPHDKNARWGVGPEDLRYLCPVCNRLMPFALVMW